MWAFICKANRNKKEAMAAILIANKIELREKIIRNKEETHIQVKVISHQEKYWSYTFMPKNIVLQCKKHHLTECQREINE